MNKFEWFWVGMCSGITLNAAAVVIYIKYFI